MGCRYPAKWGGRDMDWVSTCMVMEEIGVLGYIFACIFGGGAELVCDAIIRHGSDEQKEKYVKPLLEGKLFAAECLTEPRGGSDFFGTTTVAEDKGSYFLLNGRKRFIVGGEGADYFLVYARTDPGNEPHKSISCFIVDRTEGVVMGGIGYTNIYPVERIFRDLRLASIWTGTNEVMSMIIANEWYKQYWKDKDADTKRDMESVAAEADAGGENTFE